MPLSTVATANASAAEFNVNTTAPTASNITTTVKPTVTVAATALPLQSPPAMRPLMQPPANSPRSPASVTFQMPSYDKTAANIPSIATATSGANGIASGSNSNSSNTTTPTCGPLQQLHHGILKSLTPPPRPPPPFKAAPPPLQKRNVANVTPTKVERVQSKNIFITCTHPLIYHIYFMHIHHTHLYTRIYLPKIQYLHTFAKNNCVFLMNTFIYISI
ncbi:uncharacterized protein [Bactrocera oleae]|uniref:uncharacterized protein n=1 Tax=Bactrocera oleae TaxID=104688 RepID=UPI00387E24A7